MTIPILASIIAVLMLLTFAAWRRYLWVAARSSDRQVDTCPYSLTDVEGDRHLVKAAHQKGARWLSEIFGRTAKRFPDFTALQIPYTGESLTFTELDDRAETVASAVAPFLTGPDQVVAVAMTQDNWHIVAAHLGILKAGGVVMFLDTSLPDVMVTHMLEDARPVVVLTRGQENIRDLPTLDVLTLPAELPRCKPPPWLDDPTQRLAAIFYTSGTTGMPKGVECPHAGYVNLALSYADAFDLVPGMDATSLTSSMGYDGSISEMYSAWVSGCAVVLLTKEQIRSGPGLVPVLCEAEVTVLFCPPVLLTTLTPAPELDLPYPVCRYIVPAGEPFPASLVEPWTRARRQIINTYGPTEASTDTSRQSLRPGDPVTIGSPFANVTYVILEVGGSRPLPHGQEGELCIGGVQVALGYRNLPEQTAEVFISHPRFGRLYRTGDRCWIDSRTQRVYFLGRVDAQLKVRGHRVEVEAVEGILQTEFAEIEAAVLDNQNDELVAFVAAPSLPKTGSSSVSPAPVDWTAQVTATLAERLPDPSVPTTIFLVDGFVMKSVSGKIDRDRLPRLTDLSKTSEARFADRGSRLPATTPGSEATAAAPAEDDVLAICRGVLGARLGWDDAFADHGGHSIAIARLSFHLRNAGWDIPVGALLSDCDTARKIAERPQTSGRASTSSVPTAQPGPSLMPRDESAARVLPTGLFTTLQILFLSLLYAPPLLGLITLVVLAETGELFTTANLLEFIGVGTLAYLSALAVPFAGLLWVVIIKLFIGGHPSRNRVTPGAYPKWSRMHLRVWCIEQLQRSVLWSLGKLFRSTPLMSLMLRRLGATVGDNSHCAHDVEFSGPLDLLSIEDDVAIQTGAYISMSMWVGHELHIGPVRLSSGSTIGMRAAVAANVTVGRGSRIAPFTPIMGDVGEHEMWEEAPARLSGRCTELNRTANLCRSSRPLWFSESLNILMQVFLNLCLLVVPTAAVSWFAATFMPFRHTELAAAYFRVTPLEEIVWQLGLYAFITTWATFVVISVLSCGFVRLTATSPGLYPLRGFRAALLLYRMKTMNQIQRLWTWTVTGQYLRALAGLRFSRVGASECDVMYNLVPELASADSQVFWSHGCYTNMVDVGAKHLTLRQLDMPANFFSSNNCVAESGQLPTNFLLGVSTPASEIRFRRQMRSRLGEPITVAGNPPVRFASMDFEAENQTQPLPSFPLFLGRVLLNDFFSIGMLRVANILAYVFLYTILLRLSCPPILSALAALVLAEVVLVVLCVAIKTLLVGGRWGSDHSAPFWSWRHFTYFFAQDCYFAWCRLPLMVTAGTVLSNVILRWLGCRVGKRTIFATPLQAFDWNAVSVGDDCIVGGILQFHTFENMRLKVKRTEVKNGSTVNFGTTVMGGAVIEPNTTILPLSLILKEMHLPTNTYEGSPAEPAGGPRICSPPTTGSRSRTEPIESSEAVAGDAATTGEGSSLR